MRHQNPTVGQNKTILILRSIILVDLSKREKDDKTSASNTAQGKWGPSQSDISASQDQTDSDVDSMIAIANNKNTLQSFIERSPLGLQFAIIVLFYLARSSFNTSNTVISADKSTAVADLSPFSFTSREFLDAYSQLASEMGLTKYLVRHIAFAEFMLTLQYLALVREDELTGNYRFKADYEDLKWLASLALQQIAGGHGLSSPEIFYPSPLRATMPAETPAQPDKTVNPPTMTNTERTTELIKDLSLSIFSREEIELNQGGGTSKGYDDFVRPRSKDYGLHRPYFPHRVPPTMYSFRKADDSEWKRIINEFFEGRKCITCNSEVLPQQFDIWIGEPLEDSVTTGSNRDLRMSDVLAGIDDNASANTTGDDAAVVTSPDKLQIIDYDTILTDRELLTYNYGIIPMDGRNAFIAFAKPKLPCPSCGTNPANSVSLMPKY